MTSPAHHINVCICTFRRPQLLGRLLKELQRQQTNHEFTFSIIVADNDRERTGEGVVTKFAAGASIPVVYCFEPQQNIAMARNRALSHVTGDHIAFIDDDEFPQPDWLLAMLRTREQFQAAGVLGPVRPHFDEPPPRWIIAGGFCERPEYPSGRIMPWEECRTGNVLFKTEILAGNLAAFNPEFGTGGEDKDFFMRMSQLGHVFRWCNEGIAYETVPPSRWKRSYMLRRAMLRGRNILKHPEGRARLLAQSAIAAPAYLLVLPPTFLFGQHVFMKYCIKFCDHFGRLLAWVGLNRVSER